LIKFLKIYLVNKFGIRDIILIYKNFYSTELESRLKIDVGGSVGLLQLFAYSLLIKLISVTQRRFKRGI